MLTKWGTDDNTLYNADSGEFLDLEKRLAFIIVRVDQDEAFFSYGYDKSKSTKLYFTSKKQLPNIFSSTCFKKHQDFLVEQRSTQEKSTFVLLTLHHRSFSGHKSIQGKCFPTSYWLSFWSFQTILKKRGRFCALRLTIERYRKTWECSWNYTKIFQGHCWGF